MKTTSLLFIFLFGIFAYLPAQECTAYFPFSKGTILEYGNYNKKGKLQSKTIHLVEEVESSAGAIKATVSNEVLDDDGDKVSESSYIATCENNQLSIDITSMLAPGMTQAFANMEVSMEGDPLLLPSNLSAGQTLPDANSKIKAGSGGVNFLSMSFTVTDRKVEAIEDVTVSSGETYSSCAKVAYTMVVKVGFKKTIKVIQWYHPEYGAVKTENYNKKGKLDSYMELISVKKS